jgi:hypothetical protein
MKPCTYAWQTLYLSAISEANPAEKSRVIYEAVSAIEERLLSPIELGGEEKRSITEAQRNLQALRGIRLEATS